MSLCRGKEKGNSISWRKANVASAEKWRSARAAPPSKESILQKDVSLWPFFPPLLVGFRSHFRLSFLKSFSSIQVQTVTGPADPSLFAAPSLIGHRQLQLDCKDRACALPSLHFFILLSVCLKNEGKNNLHGRGLTISAIFRMLLATPRTSRNNREKSFHLYVRVCAGYSPRVKAIYSSTVAELHSSCQLARLPVEADRPAASSGHLDQLKGHVCHISHDHADVVSLTYL